MIFKIGILIIFVISSIEDIRKKEILLWEILTCALISVAAVFMAFYRGRFDILDVLLSLLPGAAMLFLSYVTREGIGYGDGLIILAAGPALGIYDLLASLVTAAVLSGLFSGILLAIKRANRKTQIAFAPFVAIGCFASMALGFGGWQ
jgi:prepilin signal peptidase PulO-like enzyme (type II secretory pathway)